jgi:hypothetical protein
LYGSARSARYPLPLRNEPAWPAFLTMDRMWLPIMCAALLLLIVAAAVIVGRPELIDAAIAVKTR